MCYILEKTKSNISLKICNLINVKRFLIFYISGKVRQKNKSSLASVLTHRSITSLLEKINQTILNSANITISLKEKIIQEKYSKSLFIETVIWINFVLIFRPRNNNSQFDELPLKISYTRDL